MNIPLTEQLQYHNGQLHMEASNITSLATEYPTPFYCYSQARLLDNIRRCQAAFTPRGIAVHYAMKANSNMHILSLISDQGLGADTVSGGEIQRAVSAGFPPERIIFSGVGKSAAEIRQALEVGIGQFNVESAEELMRLASLAETANQPVRVALRVNPDVAVDTHRHITTGTKGNKFGIEPAQALKLFREYASHPRLRLSGLAMHIGSQICDATPYRQALSRLLSLVSTLKYEGITISHLDLGGGFGIDYGNGNSLSFEDAARTIAETLASEAPDYTGDVVVEPGRSIIADAGILVTTVNYVKQAEPRPFLILDAAMNDLMRPALYQAEHPLIPAHRRGPSATEQFDVVGPVCESTDTFSRNTPLDNAPQAGDIMAFLCAGAYCSVMSSGYNSRDITAELLIGQGQATLIRRRITQADLMQFEQ